MRRAVGVATASLALLAACAPPDARSGSASRPSVAVTSAAAGSAPTTAGAPSPSPSGAVRRHRPARFAGTISPIPPALAASMRGRTWHRGCPVPLRDLRLLTLRYWGFDGHVHQGPMVIKASVAGDVVSAFHTLFRARFPIERIHLAIPFHGVDTPPTDRRDFTMGFNCRPALTAHGPLTTWSQHAYGLAIDVNPLQNPYVASDGFIREYASRRYRARSQHLRGMIHRGDVVVRAFAAIGWTWGGTWSGDRDYMHFSITGH